MASQSRSNEAPRVFEYNEAKRGPVPLFVGLVGPSSSGKTVSALRLASGIQRVVGGDIAGVDTEAGRMIHHADKYKFHHIPFGAPFSPGDYLAAIEFAVKKGAKTIIVDSASHLHEGPGGVLEMHEAELQRLGGGERNNFPAWAYPKMELRRFLNALLQMKANFIFCFRAKNKTKIERGEKGAKKLGFMPIASDEFIYEMTTNALLYPNSSGVPTWQSDALGEREIIKLPRQFRNVFGPGVPFDEEQGQKMAEWAVGGDVLKGDATFVKDRDAWFDFWAKKGVPGERVLSVLGKATADDMDRRDLMTLRALLDDVKSKRTTVAVAFPVSQAPTDDDNFDETASEDGEGEGGDEAPAPAASKATETPPAEKGDEPTAEEWAAIEAANQGKANGPASRKGARR